jgi:hypothetical protein
MSFSVNTCTTVNSLSYFNFAPNPPQTGHIQSPLNRVPEELPERSGLRTFRKLMDDWANSSEPKIPSIDGSVIWEPSKLSENVVTLRINTVQDNVPFEDDDYFGPLVSSIKRTDSDTLICVRREHIYFAAGIALGLRLEFKGPIIPPLRPEEEKEWQGRIQLHNEPGNKVCINIIGGVSGIELWMVPGVREHVL